MKRVSLGIVSLITWMLVALPGRAGAQPGTCEVTVHNSYSGAVTVTVGSVSRLIGSGGSTQVALSGPVSLCVWSCVWNGMAWVCGWSCPATACPGGAYDVFRSGPPEALTIGTTTAGFCGPVSFDSAVDPAAPTVHFVDQSTGSTHWYWKFGDGQTSSAESPQHDYIVPVCRRRTFAVEHWAGRGAACMGPVSEPVTVYNAPAPQSQGKAVVIVGNVRGFGSADDAANLAVQRLQQSGFEVNAPLGSSSAPATWSSIADALDDPTVTAIWIVAHGLDRQWQQSHGFSFEAANSAPVTQGNIRNWRQGATPLRELTISSCYAGGYFDPTAWGTDPGTTRVNINNPRPGYNQHGEDIPLTRDRAVVLGVEARQLERARACDPPPDPAPLAFEGTVGVGGSPFIPMLLTTSDGIPGDSLYGTIAGSEQTAIVGPAGTASFGDPVARVSGTLSGKVPGDTLAFWMNRYSTAPLDTLPPAETIIAGFFVDGSTDASGTVLTFGYGHEVTDVTRLEVWRFDDSLRVFTSIEPVVDSVARTASISTDRWGVFVLVEGPSLVAVDGRPADAPMALKLIGNPMKSGAELRVSFSTARGGSARARVLDLAGAVVATLLDGEVGPGLHALRWDGSRSDASPAPAGMYFLRLEVGTQSRTSTIARLR